MYVTRTKHNNNLLVNEINLLLKFERNREILMQYKVDNFSKEEIALMEKDFDDILELAKVENEFIPYIYWKKKQ